MADQKLRDIPWARAACRPVLMRVTTARPYDPLHLLSRLEEPAEPQAGDREFSLWGKLWQWTATRNQNKPTEQCQEHHAETE